MFSGCPDSIRVMSGSGPFFPILKGVWQSLQAMTVTRYRPPPTRSAEAAAGAAPAGAPAGAPEAAGAPDCEGGGASSLRHAAEKDAAAARAADASMNREIIRPIDHSPCPAVRLRTASNHKRDRKEERTRIAAVSIRR